MDKKNTKMNNEIKEMKEIIAQATIEAEGLPFLETNEHIATVLYNTGYRKQQSTVDKALKSYNK